MGVPDGILGPSCKSSMTSWAPHATTRACPPPSPSSATRRSVVRPLPHPPRRLLPLQLLAWRASLPKLPLCPPAALLQLCIHLCSARARFACANPLVSDSTPLPFCTCKHVMSTNKNTPSHIKSLCIPWSPYEADVPAVATALEECVCVHMCVKLHAI